MTDAERATLESWLKSDDEVARRHAVWRLSVTDAELEDAERAAKLIAENPPQAGERPCCNG